jgi:hypothetical protein
MKPVSYPVRLFVLEQSGRKVKLTVQFHEVLTAVNMSVVVFWVVTSCSLAGGYLLFGGTYRLHLKDW